MSLNGIHHVAIKTKAGDYDKVISFYTDLLGMEKIRSWGSGDQRGAMLSCGGGNLIEIMSNAEGDFPVFGAYRHIAFKTDDVDGIIEKVRKAGFRIEQEPADLVMQCEKPYPIRVAFCRGVLDEQIEFFCEK